jgi:hypothetical protein
LRDQPGAPDWSSLPSARFHASPLAIHRSAFLQRLVERSR